MCRKPCRPIFPLPGQPYLTVACLTTRPLTLASQSKTAYVLALAQKSCQGLVFYAFFVFTHAVVWIDPAVERLCLMDRARVEACFLSFQKGATLRYENCVLIVRVSGINRYVLQDVFSSLPLPTHYVLVGHLKRAPMNNAAVSRSLAPVSLQQLIIQIRPYAAHKLE